MKIELTPPESVKRADHESASDIVKLDKDDIVQLDSQVDAFVSTILQNSPDADKFKDSTDNIHNIGAEAIRNAAEISGRMLERPMNSTESGLFDDTSPVARALINLRQIVESLDPSSFDNLFLPK